MHTTLQSTSQKHENCQIQHAHMYVVMFTDKAYSIVNRPGSSHVQYRNDPATTKQEKKSHTQVI